LRLDSGGGLAFFRLFVVGLRVFSARGFVIFEYAFSEVVDEILIVRIILRVSLISNHRLLLRDWR